MDTKTKVTDLITILLIAIIFVIISGWACDGFANSSDADSTTALPFEFLKWMAWKSDMEMGETENDGRYKSLSLSDNKDLQKLINTIYPEYINTRYFLLKSNMTDYVVLITISTISGEYVLFYNLVILKQNKIIASLPLITELAEYNDNDYAKNFIISENLKITITNEKGLYNDEEDRWIATEKKEVGVYQIQKDGSIIKVK